MKIAILGIGAMGRTVIGHIAKCPQVSEVFVYDLNPEALERARMEGGVTCCDTLESVLQNDEVSLVFVTAPNSAHKDLTLAALRAGKAVMVEKPIATTPEDSAEIVAEAERSGSFLQVGFELRYSLLYTKVKEWIDAGILGKVINTHCDYIGSEFFGKGSWRNSLKTGGSMFGEKLCHYVDLPRWWLGDDVEEVYAVSAPNVVQYYEIRDNYHVIYRFRGGGVSQLTFMMYVAETFDGDPLVNSVSQQTDDGHELRFLVVGTEGAAETDVFRRRIRRWEFGDSPKGMTSKIVETITWGEDEDHYYFHNTEYQTLDIIQRVLNGEPPKTSARDSLRTMQLCDAVETSIDEKRTVALPRET